MALAPNATFWLGLGAMARGPRKLRLAFAAPILNHFDGVYLLQ